MARVSVDKKALTDPRFVRLGSHFVNNDDFIDGCDGTHGDVALNDLQRAFGLWLALKAWDLCSDQGVTELWEVDVDCIQLGLAEAMCKSELADRDEFGMLRMRGCERLMWAIRAKENGAKGAEHGEKGAKYGKLGGRPRKTPHQGGLITPPRGVSKNPPLFQKDEKARNGALTKTPPLTTSSSGVSFPPEDLKNDPPTETHPDAPERASGTPPVPRGAVKPSKLVNGERHAWLEKRFLQLYEWYPRHAGKAAAWKAFLRLNPADDDFLRQIVEDVRRRVTAGEWQPDGRMEYIPHMSTYLNQRRWEDGDAPDSRSDRPDPQA